MGETDSRATRNSAATSATPPRCSRRACSSTRPSTAPGERLGVYAYLKTTEDQANSDYQRMKGRYQHVATKAAEAASYIRPEMLAIPTKKMARVPRRAELAEWRLVLERIIRYRPHTLGKKEEHLLAMQGADGEAQRTRCSASSTTPI